MDESDRWLNFSLKKKKSILKQKNRMSSMNMDGVMDLCLSHL